MAPGPEDVIQPQGGVFVRLLQLPMVSATRQVLQETYSSTKQTHPLICTVCGVYESGARKAGSLAVWTIRPAIHRLEPHTVDDLACKGLDRLEEKIPALQYSPDKLAAGIAEMVTSTMQSAREGFSRPITSTSDKALGVASSGYQLTRSAVSGGVDYVLNSAPVRLAGEGADAALTLTEHLVSYILPASAEEMESDSFWQQDSDPSEGTVQPGYKRLGSLVAVVCRRAYDRTARGIQRTGARGRDLALSVPGVSPLAGLAWRNLAMAGGLAVGLQTSVVGLVTGKVKQSDKEKRKKKEGELLRSGGILSLLNGLAQQLQSASVTTVASLKSAPGVTFDLAKEGLVTLQGALGAARKHMPPSVSRYGLSPGPSMEEGTEVGAPNEGGVPRDQVSNGSAQEQKEEAGCPGDEEGPARPSEAARQPHQQRVPEPKAEGTRSPGSSQVRAAPTSHPVAKKE